MELFLLVAIEAMKYSKAIIASNRGALNEIVRDNINGFLFDFDNFDLTLDKAINKFINKDIKKIGEKSYLIFKKEYANDNMQEEIKKLYHDLFIK